jgi:hypothetical protein
MGNKLMFPNEEGVECEDLLDSNKYIQEFHSIITDSPYSVYAVSGEWGTGKTCFVKMWENTLKNSEQIFVHIDAFRMDYESEPFIMLVKAFKEFMNKKQIDEGKIREFLNKAKEYFSIKNILKLGLNIIADKTIGSGTVKEFVNNAYDTCFNMPSAEESLYDQLVCLLSKITEQFEYPVYIIIDELDRCRPDFALETLERIKHIFHVKNVKFILVYNEKVLTSMINHRYGDAIDARKYLTKFVQKEYPFDNRKPFRQWFLKEVYDNKIFMNSDILSTLRKLDEPFWEIKKRFNLSLRDIQRILTSLEQYKNDLSLFLGLVTIEFLKHINKQQFEYMVEYYAKNQKFDPNTPDRDIFNRIFTILSNSYSHSPVNPDEYFYEYAKKYLQDE